MFKKRMLLSDLYLNDNLVGGAIIKTNRINYDSTTTNNTIDSSNCPDLQEDAS